MALQAEASVSEQKTRDFVGTAVTVESFAIWRTEFDAEMQSAPKTTVKDEATTKLTGTAHCFIRSIGFECLCWAKS